MIAAILIFVFAILGALPAFVVLRRRQQPRTRDGSSTCALLPSCCSSNYGAAASACCFGASPFYVRAATVYTAGVVAAVALLHLLPAADRQLSSALGAIQEHGGPHWGPEYPAAALCCLVGLLLSAALEAVVEQLQQRPREKDREGPRPPDSPSSQKEGLPLSAVSPLPQRRPETAATSSAAGAGGATGGAAGGSATGGLVYPRATHWEEDRGPPGAGRGGGGSCGCEGGIGGAPCRGPHLNMEIVSAPSGPIGRPPGYCAFPAAWQQPRRTCCGAASCCSSSGSSSSSSSSNGEANARLLSCPYTLMDEGTVGSAHPQQRKRGPQDGAVPASPGDPQGGGAPRAGSLFVGSLLLAGLSVHSVMEGLTLGAAPNPKTVAIAILFHKTLEAFAVGSSLLHGE